MMQVSSLVSGGWLLPGGALRVAQTKGMVAGEGREIGHMVGSAQDVSVGRAPMSRARGLLREAIWCWSPTVPDLLRHMICCLPHSSTP